MIHRRLSALALVASGALVVTTTTMLPSFAADADRAEASSPNLADATSPFTIIVHLEEGADREVTLASINQAVAGVYPDATVEVEREYKNALQGYALRVPAGSLDAIRGVSGVKMASIERETRIQ